MLQGLLIVLVLALAFGLFYVIYGKEGVALRKEQGKNSGGVLAAVVLLLIFWMMCVMFLSIGAAANDEMLCIVVAVAVPMIFVIWTITARMHVKKALAQKAQRSEEAAQEPVEESTEETE